MAEEVFGFDRPGMQRAVRAVREVERDPVRGAGAVPNVERTPTFWIELTGEPSTGRYSWKKVYPIVTGSGWADAAPPQTGTGNASETNLTAGIPAGVRVEARFIGYDGETPAYMFQASIVAFRVNTAKTWIEADFGGGHWANMIPLGC